MTQSVLEDTNLNDFLLGYCDVYMQHLENKTIHIHVELNVSWAGPRQMLEAFVLHGNLD